MDVWTNDKTFTSWLGRTPFTMTSLMEHHQITEDYWLSLQPSTLGRLEFEPKQGECQTTQTSHKVPKRLVDRLGSVKILIT